MVTPTTPGSYSQGIPLRAPLPTASHPGSLGEVCNY